MAKFVDDRSDRQDAVEEHATRVLERGRASAWTSVRNEEDDAVVRGRVPSRRRRELRELLRFVDARQRPRHDIQPRRLHVSHRQLPERSNDIEARNPLHDRVDVGVRIWLRPPGRLHHQHAHQRRFTSGRCDAQSGEHGAQERDGTHEAAETTRRPEQCAIKG
jgi:hypothetical protein